MGDIRTEPSMEDILASIKRIIADDGLAANGPRPRFRMDGAGAPIAPVAEPVLELTDPVAPPAAEPEPAPPELVEEDEPAEAEATVAAPPAFAEAVPEPAPEPAPQEDTPAAALVSEDTACASRQALSNLSSLVLRTPDSDNTLDGLVRALLRPMLKEWLDSHLPDLVETLVSREIARITGKSL